MRIILGGTFDPVHLGHLRVAWEVSEHFDEPVWLMPAGQPPHREAPVAGAEQRCDLLARALLGQSRLLLDQRELQQEGPSYTVRSLEELRSSGETGPIGLIIGADAYAQIETWHRWQELAGLCHLIVLSRPGPQRAERDCESWQRVSDPTALHTQTHGLVYHLEVTRLAISASDIRGRLRAGDSVRYLVPESCLDDLASIYGPAL